MTSDGSGLSGVTVLRVRAVTGGGDWHLDKLPPPAMPATENHKIVNFFQTSDVPPARALARHVYRNSLLRANRFMYYSQKKKTLVSLQTRIPFNSIFHRPRIV